MLVHARPTRGSASVRLWFPMVVLLLAAVPQLIAQTVATYSFEDGTADGWTSFYYASTPSATNAAAYSGSYSLLTSTGAGGTGGPAISLSKILQPGAKYTITGYVRLASGQAASNANFTIQRSDPSCSGGTCYDTVGSYKVAVDDSGWVQIGGAYTASPTENGLLLYAQLVGATSAVPFYLDEVVITQTAPPPGGTPVASYTFQGGSLDGWSPFGPVTLQSTTSPMADPSGNTSSLLTTNRTGGWMGPSLNLLGVNNVVAGATYQVSAYIMLANADAANPTATLSLKTADCASTGIYSNIATSGPLSNSGWTKVQGTFSFSDQPGPPTSLVLYVQSSSATDAFYLSDVVIGELSPPPLPQNDQDNSGISSTFEDGALDGWGSRSGSSTVANSTDGAHSGTHSLLTSNRIANWDGPVINVSNKMYNGSVYNVSGWVKLVPTDGSTHTINISLQTTLDGNTSYPTVTAYPGIAVPADGQWHQVSVNGFNMASAYDPGTASLYFQTVSSGSDLVSFYLDDFQLTYVAPPTIQTEIPSIYKKLSPFFPVGAAVDPSDLSGPHAQLLAKHFDSITPGNEMKWSSVESTKGNFTYGNADSEVDLAVCNQMRVRGHNLVWATGAQTPSYAAGDGTNSSANQATVISNIQEHIQNEVQHFGNKVYLWDVINEPLDPSQPDCLYHGPFYQVLGKSYIDVALKAARQYAPAGTKLYINDYSTYDPNRFACLVRLVSDLRSRGIPLDGIGHESHNAINYPSVKAMAAAINTLHAKFPDLEQQITEYDESVYNAGDIKSDYGDAIPPAVLAEQGWLYNQTFDVFRKLKGKISAVTIWGMADDDTWLDGFPVARTDYPLPFDHQLQAKPAYWALVDDTKLPGYGLKLTAVTQVTGTNTRQVVFTAKNGDAGPAYNTQITGFGLRQIWGPPCKPKVSASYPIPIGDIPTSGSGTASINIAFPGCAVHTGFAIEATWSSATYETGQMSSFINLDPAE